ncbi:MAG: 30S ribosomal protein S4 [Planctomycetota bacterium]|jgi:small subunit ribosomal protein S4|nr:30S ribosomal protein S4 [Planctomycetota bacterium]MDP6941814.1 30S ribosomal protein S4 [Planctomycetota bacterium]
MARYTGNVCRLCRREGYKLFLKGSRCESEKCAVDRRNVPPGMNVRARTRRLSDYGVHLREKQKVKRIYGLMERQFKRYFRMAERMRGNTGTNLLSLLERRLDNVVDATGMAMSRPHARQRINHGHFTVNGRKVDVPSYLVRPGDVVGTATRENSQQATADCLTLAGEKVIPNWLAVDSNAKTVKIVNNPSREDVRFQDIQEQFIVELCSK